MALLTIGDTFPEFSLTALKGGDLHDVEASQPEDYFETVTSSSYPGKWLVVFFYPKDFTFVCPTERAAFGKTAMPRSLAVPWITSSPTSTGVQPTPS